MPKFYMYKIDHSWEHKASLNTIQRTETLQGTISDDSRVKLESITKKVTRKSPTVWKLSNTLLK